MCVVVQQIYSQMHPISCTNTHHDFTDLVNHWIRKNTKTWISQEQKITFLWNKKTFYLFLRWHILRSSCFVAEVTFKRILWPGQLCYNFFISGGLTQLVNFPTWIPDFPSIGKFWSCCSLSFLWLSIKFPTAYPVSSHSLRLFLFWLGRSSWSF